MHDKSNDTFDDKIADVYVDHSSKGKGKLVIKYNSLDELDGIIAHIR